MKIPLLLPPLLMLAACAGREVPYAPTQNVRYAALGEAPFWTVTIGDDSIVLALGADSGAGEGRLESFTYPRVLPSTQAGVTRWESGEGTSVISVEARRERCPGSRGMAYEDRVTVSLSGRRLEGCGGRIVERGSR
ncbi:MAG TPA: hypothetical protein VEZ70_04440 [Allosphingosinicella sp.]|nr:hypothetical protein [Allosphingosinicella sp.]